ncbi:hypothetical protein NDU88_008446 [Pleurodeles waltl]|uniref:Uncharacterized protein n=1 Tax=Pleurodeles waltl TaxID=8319 RepID=A0AAV7RVR1_PLEWA|nr:hypothetical protein NDU88_008446 [Pleurodeles waltl]
MWSFCCSSSALNCHSHPPDVAAEPYPGSLDRGSTLYPRLAHPRPQGRAARAPDPGRLGMSPGSLAPARPYTLTCLQKHSGLGGASCLPRTHLNAGVKALATPGGQVSGSFFSLSRSHHGERLPGLQPG